MLDDFTFFDLLGVIGSLTICAAYFAVSSGRLDPQRTPYQLFNIAGAALLLVSLWFRPNPGAILIEAIWVLIALWSLAQIWLRRAR